MFKNNPESPEPSFSNTPSSNTPGWLSEMRPASASSLQASVFYQAGYEAARQELSKAAWRRAGFVAMAASVLVTSVSGAFLFQLGKQNGQRIAVSKQDQETQPIDAPERSRELQLAAASPKREIAVEGSPSLVPSWIQSQFSRMLPIAKPRISLLGPGVELGREGADLDKIIVMDSVASPHSPTKRPVENSQSNEPQSLRSMRDNRIKFLMESLL